MILERHRFRGGDSVGALHPTKDVWDPCESIRGGRRTVQRLYAPSTELIHLHRMGANRCGWEGRAFRWNAPTAAMQLDDLTSSRE